MKYELLTHNPYTNEHLGDGNIGILMKGRWQKKYIDLFAKEKVNCLFLNYTYDWDCDNYHFLSEIPKMKSIDIIDVPKKGLTAIETQDELVELNLNLHITENLNLGNLSKLERCYIPWSKYVTSIFNVVSLKKL